MNKKTLEFNSKKYSQEILEKIGNYVASLWGAYCIKYDIISKKQVVQFTCIEHGETFVADVEFQKLDEYII